jgi:integrase
VGTRYPNPHLVKIHRSYTIDEVQRALGVHENTARNWAKAGLPLCDDRRPILILGCHLLEFLSGKRKQRRFKCGPGQFPCLRCRVARAPAPGMIDLRPMTSTTGNLVARCSVCETIMYRRVNLARFHLSRGNFQVTLPESLQHIDESRSVSVSCDLQPEGKPMKKRHHPDNERIKHKFLTHMREARGYSENSVDMAAKAVARFESYTKFCDFKLFRTDQAVNFKRHLAEQQNQRTGAMISKAALHSTFGHLKRFILWLADQPCYRSRIRYSDADYFTLTANDVRVATARRDAPYPTLEQVRHVLTNMPHATEIERRDRALAAFTLLTGARVRAIASLRLKHVDLAAATVFFDAREVRTKFRKTFSATFFPVGDDVLGMFTEWVAYLKTEKLWSNDEPLFPRTKISVSAANRFEATSIDNEPWTTSTPIRDVFRKAFSRVGLPYFNPHSLRKTLVSLGKTRCKGNIEAFTAWSKNLGHEDLSTTLGSYGDLSLQRQVEIIRGLSAAPSISSDVKELAKQLVREMKTAAVEY